jgi:hypothetical protein
MTAYTKLTAETVTDREIRALCREATQAGDLKMADIASRALDPCEDIIDPNEVTALRQLCADAINNARAQTAETRAAIESLRSFAVSHGELPFAHLCTSALAGEEWARWRVSETLKQLDDLIEDGVEREWAQNAVINSTNTTRPDGAVARHMEAP